MTYKHSAQAVRSPLSVLADFVALAAMNEQMVTDFLSDLVDDVAPSMSTEELVGLRAMAGRLEQACALEDRFR